MGVGSFGQKNGCSWRCWAVLAGLIFLGGLGGVTPAAAGGTPNPPGEVLQQAEMDLNGDGTSENITFSLNPATEKFVITVAGSRQSGAFESDDPPQGFTIIDIDKNDKYKEIMVMCPGSSDAHVYYLFAYDGKRLNKIGQLTRSLDFPGDGIVRVQDWAGFWVKHDKYVLDRPRHFLKKVPQEFYYVGVPATVKKTFPIYATRNDKTVVAKVRPQSKVIILLCASFQETPQWYILKTETGLVGWVREEIFQEHLEGIPWAG